MQDATRSNKHYISCLSLHALDKRKKEKDYDLFKKLLNKRIFDYFISKGCYVIGFSTFSYKTIGYCVDDEKNYISIPPVLGYKKILSGLTDIVMEMGLSSSIDSLGDYPEWRLTLFKDIHLVWSGHISSYKDSIAQDVCFLVDQVLFQKDELSTIFFNNGVQMKDEFKNCSIGKYLYTQLKNGYLDVNGIYGESTFSQSIDMKRRFLRCYDYMKQGFIPIHGCMDTLGKFTIATTFESLNLSMSRSQVKRYKNVTCPISLKKINEMEKLEINRKIHTPIILSEYGTMLYELKSFIFYLDNMNPTTRVPCPFTRQFLH